MKRSGATFVLHKCYYMDNQRSYEKQSFKSKPTGIRFNLEQEKIAFARSRRKTRQQLVDFLLENYVKADVPLKVIQENTAAVSEQINMPIMEIRKTPYEWVCEKREIPDGDIDSYNKWFKRLQDCTYLNAKEKTEIKMS